MDPNSLLLDINELEYMKITAFTRARAYLGDLVPNSVVVYKSAPFWPKTLAWFTMLSCIVGVMALFKKIILWDMPHTDLTDP